MIDPGRQVGTSWRTSVNSSVRKVQRRMRGMRWERGGEKLFQLAPSKSCEIYRGRKIVFSRRLVVVSGLAEAGPPWNSNRDTSRLLLCDGISWLSNSIARIIRSSSAFPEGYIKSSSRFCVFASRAAPLVRIRRVLR